MEVGAASIDAQLEGAAEVAAVDRDVRARSDSVWLDRSDRWFRLELLRTDGSAGWSIDDQMAATRLFRDPDDKRRRRPTRDMHLSSCEPDRRRRAEVRPFDTDRSP